MSLDGLLPPVFAHLNSRTQVMDVSIVFVCALSAGMTLLFEVDTMGNIAALCGILVAATVDIALVVVRYDSESYESRRVTRCCALFAFVCILCGATAFGSSAHWAAVIPGVILVLLALYIQQQKQTNLPKHFSCPGVPFVPLIGAASFLFLGLALEAHVWLSCSVAAGVAVVSYFLYGFWQPTSTARTAKLPALPEKELKETELLQQRRDSD